MTAAAPVPVRWGGLARLLVLGTIWGTSFVWIKLGLDSVNAPMVTAIRAALGAVLLLSYLALRRQPLPSRALWGHLAFLAFIGIALPYTLFALAELTISSSLAGAINSATPLFTLLFGLIPADRQRPSAAQLAGLGLGFVGTLVMMRPWDQSAPLLGTVLAVLASACYGIVFVHSARHVSGRAEPLALAATQLALAAPMAALAAPFFGRAVGHVTPTAAGALLVLGLLGTGVAYLLNYRIIADDGPLLASTVTYIIPVVTIVVGVAFLHEPLPASTAVGIAITLAGIALTRRQRRA